MGNCQAAETAMVVIQHPGGSVERLYWPIRASEVMRNNPGHYVAWVTLSQPSEGAKRDEGAIRVTRVKLLRAKDTLLLGQVYRLLTSQEVMKGLWSKKYGKTRKSLDSEKKEKMNEIQGFESKAEAETGKSEPEDVINQDSRSPERHQEKSTHGNLRTASQWRPSLQSISEVGI